MAELRSTRLTMRRKSARSLSAKSIGPLRYAADAYFVPVIACVG